MDAEKKDRREFINPHFRDLCNAARNLRLAFNEPSLALSRHVHRAVSNRLAEIMQEATIIAIKSGRIPEAEGGDMQMEKLRQEIYLMRSQLNNAELVQEIELNCDYTRPL